MEFNEFLELFIEENGYYVPKDPSDNIYRHFGCKLHNKLYLEYAEVLYLYSSEYSGSDPEIIGYFNFKNMGLNLLKKEMNDNWLVYVKTKHFNRKKANPIGTLEYHGRYDEYVLGDNDKIVGIIGEEEPCFIKLNTVDKLNLSIDSKLKKY